MKKLLYDFHIHSCLSPCADDDMTPFDIAGMAKLCGLDVAALTDHNSCLNTPAFLSACKHYQILGVPGMELTTAEEIHLVCLFPCAESAMDFSVAVEKLLPPIKNRADIFGNQLIYSEDNLAGQSELFLAGAANITLSEAFESVHSLGGICYPAHIERAANGILSILGGFPDEPPFRFYETDSAKSHPLNALCALTGSDAHRLIDIGAGKVLPFEADLYRLLEALR